MYALHQDSLRPDRPRHLPMPGWRSRGQDAPETNAAGNLLSACGHNYSPDRFLDRAGFVQLKETVKREIREPGAEPAQNQTQRVCHICRSALKKALRPIINPPMPKRPWNEKDKEIVRREYQHNQDSIAHLAQKLDRSENAVKGVIQQLGITRSHGRKTWTRKQDQQLIDLAGTVSMQRIAHIMGRSTNSVVVRSKRLGITRRDHTGWYTARDVARMLGVDDHWVRTRLQSGALAGTRYTADGKQAKLDVHDPSLNGLTWRIEEKELIAFIRKYAHELTGRNVDLMQIVDLLAGITEVERQRGRPPAPKKSRKAHNSPPPQRGRRRQTA